MLAGILLVAAVICYVMDADLIDKANEDFALET
jgi:hypothetical protein